MDYLNLLNDEYRNQTIILSNTELKIDLGIKTIYPKLNNGLIDFNDAFKRLYTEGIHSILVEGGPKLITNLFNQKEFDKLTNFVAPKVIGNGRSFFENNLITDMNLAHTLKNISSRVVGQDIMWEGYL